MAKNRRRLFGRGGVNVPTKVQNSPKEEEVFFPEEVRVVRKEIAYILKVVSTH